MNSSHQFPKKKKKNIFRQYHVLIKWNNTLYFFLYKINQKHKNKSGQMLLWEHLLFLTAKRVDGHQFISKLIFLGTFFISFSCVLKIKQYVPYLRTKKWKSSCRSVANFSAKLFMSNENKNLFQVSFSGQYRTVLVWAK